MENSSKPDCELPNKMASLDIWEPSKSETSAVSEDSSEVPNRRSLRKRQTPPPTTTVSTNRRVIMKPKKVQKAALGENDLKKLYSDPSKVKNVSQKLETIFEEPKAVNDTLLFIGGTKIKRSLKFQETCTYTKEKIKKRRSKIKRLLGNKNFSNRKKIPMNAFLKILEDIEADDSPEERTSK